MVNLVPHTSVSDSMSEIERNLGRLRSFCGLVQSLGDGLDCDDDNKDALLALADHATTIHHQLQLTFETLHDQLKGRRGAA